MRQNNHSCNIPVTGFVRSVALQHVVRPLVHSFRFRNPYKQQLAQSTARDRVKWPKARTRYIYLNGITSTLPKPVQLKLKSDLEQLHCSLTNSRKNTNSLVNVSHHIPFYLRPGWTRIANSAMPFQPTFSNSNSTITGSLAQMFSCSKPMNNKMNVITLCFFHLPSSISSEFMDGTSVIRGEFSLLETTLVPLQ